MSYTDEDGNLTVQTLLEHRVVPLLERIAVALEKLSAPPSEDSRSAFLPTCSFCGATPFKDNTGHHPKCINPDRQ